MRGPVKIVFFVAFLCNLTFAIPKRPFRTDEEPVMKQAEEQPKEDAPNFFAANFQQPKTEPKSAEEVEEIDFGAFSWYGDGEDSEAGPSSPAESRKRPFNFDDLKRPDTDRNRQKDERPWFDFGSSSNSQSDNRNVNFWDRNKDTDRNDNRNSWTDRNDDRNSWSDRNSNKNYEGNSYEDDDTESLPYEILEKNYVSKIN